MKHQPEMAEPSAYSGQETARGAEMRREQEPCFAGSVNRSAMFDDARPAARSEPLPDEDDTARVGADDDGARSLALGELTYLTRGLRLNQGEVYVLRDAVVSLAIEPGCHVALACRSDMVGVHALLLSSHPAGTATVIKPGHAVLIKQDRLRKAMRSNDALHLRLLGYAFRTNASYLAEAAAGSVLTVEQRVARWLAGYAAATQSLTADITHQELATLLGVRRAGVTNALHILEGEELLRSRRSRVEILDLDGLVGFGRWKGDRRRNAGAQADPGGID